MHRITDPSLNSTTTPCNKSPANNNSLCPMLLKSPEQMFLKINHPFQQLGNKLRKVRYDKPASMFIAGSL